MTEAKPTREGTRERTLRGERDTPMGRTVESRGGGEPLLTGARGLRGRPADPAGSLPPALCVAWLLSRPL